MPRIRFFTSDWCNIPDNQIDSGSSRRTSWKERKPRKKRTQIETGCDTPLHFRFWSFHGPFLHLSTSWGTAFLISERQIYRLLSYAYTSHLCFLHGRGIIILEISESSPLEEFYLLWRTFSPTVFLPFYKMLSQLFQVFLLSSKVIDCFQDYFPRLDCEIRNWDISFLVRVGEGEFCVCDALPQDWIPLTSFIIFFCPPVWFLQCVSMCHEPPRCCCYCLKSHSLTTLVDFLCHEGDGCSVGREREWFTVRRLGGLAVIGWSTK